jgi:hypothetical protein
MAAPRICADPLRLAARRDEVTLVIEGQQVHRRCPPFAVCPSPESEDPRAEHADA